MTARLMTLSKRTPQQGAPSASRGTLSVPAAPADGRCAETQRDPGVPAGWPHRAARLPAWGTLPAPPHLRSRGAFFFLPALAGEASLRPAQPNSAEGEPTRAPLRPSAIRPARLFTKRSNEKRSSGAARALAGCPAQGCFFASASTPQEGHPGQGPSPPHCTRRAKNPILGPILGGTIHRLPRRARNQPHSGGSPFHRDARSSG